MQLRFLGPGPAFTLLQWRMQSQSPAACTSQRPAATSHGSPGAARISGRSCNPPSQRPAPEEIFWDHIHKLWAAFLHDKQVNFLRTFLVPLLGTW